MKLNFQDDSLSFKYFALRSEELSSPTPVWLAVWQSVTRAGAMLAGKGANMYILLDPSSMWYGDRA